MKKTENEAVQIIKEQTRRKLETIGSLFESLKDMKKSQNQLINGTSFQLYVLGLPNECFIHIAAGSPWHSELLKTQEKFISDLEDLIVEECKALK